MATKGGEVEFVFTGDSKDLDKDLKNSEKQVKSFADSISDEFKKASSSVTNFIKGAIGVTAVATALKEVAVAGIKYNATIEQYSTSFEVMTGSAEKATEVVEELKDVAAKTPFELSDLAETTQLLMNYGFTADDAMKKMQMLGDISQGSADKMNRIAMAYGQMSSAGKVQLEDIKQMIEAGFNPLQEISESTGESMESLYDRISKGTISVDEITASMERSTSVGGRYFQSMDKQSQTVNGQLSTLKDNWNSLLGEAMQPLSDFLSSTLLPKLNDLISSLTAKIDTANWDNLISVLNGVANAIVVATSALVGFKIGTGIQSVITGFQNAKLQLALFSAEMKGMSIATGLANGTLKITEGIVALLTGKISLAQLATSLYTKAQTALNTAMSANPVGFIISLIAALVAGFVYLWNTSEGFRNFWIGLWDGVKSAVSTAIDFVVNLFNNIVSFVKDNWQSLLLFIANPFVGGFKLLYDNCEGFRNFINNFITGIKNFFVTAWNSIVTFFTEGIPNFINSVIQWFSNLPYQIGYLIGQTIGHIIQFGIDAWNWVTNDLPQIIQGVIDWFAQLPGRIWEWLVSVVTNIAQWGVNIYTTTTTWISNTINSVVDWFAQLPSRIWNWLVNTITNVVQFIVDLRTKMENGVRNIIDNVINFFKELPSNLVEIGKNLVEGIWNGITGAADWLLNKVKEFASGIIDGIKDTLGIHSPSTVMYDVGVNVDKGYMNGIESMETDIDKAFSSAFDVSPQLKASTSNNYSSNVVVNVNNSMEFDPLGQMITKTKTFSNGSKNSYNYGMA